MYISYRKNIFLAFYKNTMYIREKKVLKNGKKFIDPANDSAQNAGIEW